MTWTNITNAQLAIGAPVRSIDLLALRDNFTAQANGDAGAPQQQTNSIADNAITGPKINKGNGIGASGTQLVISAPALNTLGSYVMWNLNDAVIYQFASYGENVTAAQLNTGGGLSGLSGTWRCLGQKSQFQNDPVSGTYQLNVFAVRIA